MWSSCIIRSHVSGRGNIGNAKAHTQYILRDEECITWAMHSCAGEITTKEQARARWEEVGMIETGLVGKDFEQGRQRRDGAIQARYIVPLPNSIIEDFDEGMVKAICELFAGQVLANLWTTFGPCMVAKKAIFRICTCISTSVPEHPKKRFEWFGRS